MVIKTNFDKPCLQGQTKLAKYWRWNQTAETFLNGINTYIEKMACKRPLCDSLLGGGDAFNTLFGSSAVAKLTTYFRWRKNEIHARYTDAVNNIQHVTTHKMISLIKTARNIVLELPSFISKVFRAFQFSSSFDYSSSVSIVNSLDVCNHLIFQHALHHKTSVHASLQQGSTSVSAQRLPLAQLWQWLLPSATPFRVKRAPYSSSSNKMRGEALYLFSYIRITVL